MAQLSPQQQERDAAKKLYQRLLRKMPDGEDIAYLNITAMMDMMTILLVFFLKQFQVSTANVNMSDDLQLAKSTSKIELHEAVAVTITKRGILVEDQPLTSVTAGRVDASVKRDGESGFFINPVYEELDKHQRRLKKLEQLSGGSQPFRGEIIVTCDRDTPYRLLSEVLYTAGQAQFARYRLLVLKKGG